MCMGGLVEVLGGNHFEGIGNGVTREQHGSE
jgi:hypothetical protein